MRRRLLNLLTALSLLLCVAAVALWVCEGSFGYNWRRSEGMNVSRGGWCFSCDSGQVGLHRQVIADSFQTDEEVLEYLRDLDADAMPPGIHWSANPFPNWIDHITGPPSLQWSWQGFGVLYRSGSVEGWSVAEQYVHFPAWFLALAGAILPGFRLLRFLRRRRRIRSTLCPTCGYDLRATPERCPECGRAAGKEEAPREVRAATGGGTGGT